MRTFLALALILTTAAAYADGHTGTLKRVSETGGFRIGFSLFEADDTDIGRWKELVANFLET